MNNIGKEIRNRGVLVSLTIRQWSGRKLDKKSTSEVTQTSGAKADRMRVHKNLIDKETLAPMAKIARAARAYHDSMTVPWTYEGVSVLPTTQYLDYDKTMAQFRNDFNEALEKFRGAYRMAVIQAARDLGSAFNAAEYPHVDDIISKFTMRLTFSPLPAAEDEDFRLNVSNELADRIASSVADQYAGLVRASQDDLLETMRLVRTRLVEYQDSLADDKVRGFRESLVEGLVHKIHIIRQANVTNDQSLAAALSLFSGDDAPTLDTDTLRSNASMRDYTIRTLKRAIGHLTGAEQE